MASVLGPVVFFLGAVVVLVGGIWFLIEAFREHVLWGLGCIFFGIVGLIFLILHFDRAAKPFFLQLGGAVIMVIGIIMMPKEQAGPAFREMMSVLTFQQATQQIL